MAEEFIQSKYYKEIGEENRWIDVHNYCCISIERFFAALLYKNDLSRIVYCTPDIAFRRRVELMDSLKGKQPELEYTPLTLGLPFMSYCQTGEIEPDDRGATQQAAQSVVGEYDPSTYQKLRSNAYKTTYEATCFFARRDEVRIASQLLYWEQEPKHPVFLTAKIRWRNQTLQIPCFMTIDKVETDIAYRESDWLTKSRIFPVKVTMTMRSYQVLVNDIEHIYKLPIKFWEKGEFYDENNSMFIVEEAILVWAQEKFDLDDTMPEIGDPSENEDVNAIVNQYFEKESYTKEQIEELIGEVPNYQTNDIIKGYLLEVPDIHLDYFMVEDQTPTSFKVKYKIKDEDKNYFNQIRFLIPTKPEIVVFNKDQTEVEFSGLENNSEYPIKILTRSETGLETLFTLRGQTLDIETNMAPQPNKINRRRGHSLVGWEF